MALPTFQALGAFVEGQTGLTVVWPAHQAGDIALLIVEHGNGETATLGGGGSAFAEVADSPQSTGGTAGTGGECVGHVYWARASSGAMANVTVNDTGNHQAAQIITFRGCIASGNPWDVTAGDTDPVGGTAISIPGDTTTVADCLVVAVVVHGRDSAVAQVTSFANASLANFAEQTDVCSASGHGGGFAVATGEKAVAGAYSATTGTLAGTSMQARISIALKPPVSSTPWDVNMAEWCFVAFQPTFSGEGDFVVNRADMAFVAFQVTFSVPAAPTEGGVTMIRRHRRLRRLFGRFARFK